MLSNSMLAWTMLVCVLSEVDVAVITVCVCVCLSFSVIIICNSVYFYFFYILLLCVVPLSGRGGWVGAVCTFWYGCPLAVSACKSLHVCTVCIWCCEHARFCVEVFMRYIYTFSFIHRFLKEMKTITSSHDYPTHTWTMFPSRNVSNNRQSQFKLKTILM